MSLESLRGLYEYELRDLRNAEQQIASMLPRLSEAAKDSRLRKQFEKHAEKTRVHEERLDGLLEELDSGAHPGVECEGMKGILKEAERILGWDGIDDSVRDAALLSVAQKVEHYEMAGYGALRTYAELLGKDDAKRTIQETLNEEGRADQTLTDIARQSVNPEARA